jgi:hypothetical protein
LAAVGDESAVLEAHVLQIFHFQLVVHQSHHLFLEFLTVALRLLRVVLEGATQFVPAYFDHYSYCCLTLFW